MLEFRSSEQTFVRRMRVAASRLDPLAASLRVQSLFASAQLSPAWLAPSAILCIRRLRASTSHALARDEPQLPDALRGALLTEIERLARAAVRPARGIVPANAESVVFADRAELLASLAADCCDRLAGARWWWRSLFKETPDRRALAKMFGEQPEYVPGTLAQLARVGKAADFAATLSDSEARALLLRVTRRFDLRELESSLASAFDAGARDPEASHRAQMPPARTGFPRAGSTHEGRAPSVEPNLSAESAPWIVFAPESTSRELSAAGQSLLGVGLTLARAPAAARQLAFARRTFNWLRRELMAASSTGHADADATADARAANERQSPLRQAQTALRVRDSGAGVAREAASGAQQDRQEPEKVSVAPVVGTRKSPAERSRARRRGQAEKEKLVRDDLETRVARAARRADSVRRETTDRSHTRAARVAHDDAGAREEGDARGEQSGVATVDNLLSTTEIAPRERALEQVIEAEIETGFGGLFFLLNLALFLNLYGDFTEPAARGLSLSPWDFIALVGRKLAGEGVCGDAGWSLLARLAGRAEGVEPGLDFEPADEWRVPFEWLKTFPNEGDRSTGGSRSTGGDWLWSHARGRLRVRHPAGFFVIDLASRAAESRRLLAREMRAYFEACPGFHLRRADKIFRARGRNARERWLERLTEYARARLQRALGVSGARRLSRLLIERHASVFVTASHLDVVMRLAELPVEIRFAGLDRDPGWLPAAGRHVAFHFE
jgi:hypothetical protein